MIVETICVGWRVGARSFHDQLNASHFICDLLNARTSTTIERIENYYRYCVRLLDINEWTHLTKLLSLRWKSWCILFTVSFPFMTRFVSFNLARRWRDRRCLTPPNENVYIPTMLPSCSHINSEVLQIFACVGAAIFFSFPNFPIMYCTFIAKAIYLLSVFTFSFWKCVPSVCVYVCVWPVGPFAMM